MPFCRGQHIYFPFYTCCLACDTSSSLSKRKVHIWVNYWTQWITYSSCDKDVDQSQCCHGFISHTSTWNSEKTLQNDLQFEILAPLIDAPLYQWQQVWTALWGSSTCLKCFRRPWAKLARWLKQAPLDKKSLSLRSSPHGTASLACWPIYVNDWFSTAVITFNPVASRHLRREYGTLLPPSITSGIRLKQLQSLPLALKPRDRELFNGPSTLL